MQRAKPQVVVKVNEDTSIDKKGEEPKEEFAVEKKSDSLETEVKASTVSIEEEPEEKV